MPPRLRTDLDRIDPYRPGRAIAEVAAAYGLDDVIKLASNESPEPPWPEVVDAMRSAMLDAHRYPDNERPSLTEALSGHLGIPETHIWCGGASNELMFMTALCMGGPSASTVYAWPSFSLYRIGSRTAFARDVAVPLTPEHRHDLEAMRSAIDDDTTLVFVCNPNNPTSTHVPGDALEAFIDSLPESTLVVVDEAYAEYATAPDFRSMMPLAASRANVMVTRTFSKVYGLAGLRVGYAVTSPDLISEFRRVQLPFSVTGVAEAAAVEALRHQDRVAGRVKRNRIEIDRISRGLDERGVPVADSQANFVYADFSPRGGEIVEALLQRGIIVRPVYPEGFLRITAGTPEENSRLLDAVDEVL